MIKADQAPNLINILLPLKIDYAEVLVWNGRNGESRLRLPCMSKPVFYPLAKLVPSPGTNSSRKLLVWKNSEWSFTR